MLVFVVKILCNLSSKGPNRKKMVQEGFVPVLTKALGNQLMMAHENDSFVLKNVQITEDLLVTLSCMSRTTFVLAKANRRFIYSCFLIA